MRRLLRPGVTEVLGERAYPTLTAVSDQVDIVDIFRRPEAVPGIVEEAIVIGAKAVWMQEGIVHNAAADQAHRQGLTVVMNRCLMKMPRAVSDRA